MENYGKMEIWKPVPYQEYDKFNEVSTIGNVRRKGKVLKTHIRNGYKAVCLYNYESKKQLTVNIHRLVAKCFIENPHSYTCVNHKDGDKTNNTLENLEWCSYKQNTEHAIKTGLSKPHPKSVEQYSLDGKYIQTFPSIIKASAKTGANDRHISCVCKGKRKTTGGFIWKYSIIEEETPYLVFGVEIKDFPNYLITEDGKVYSQRLSKFLVPKVLPNGYKCVKLCNNGKMVDAYIQKLVKEYYPPDKNLQS